MNCQPWEGGPVWVIGQQTELDEVLDDCGVPQDEDLRGRVLADVDCPGCGDNLSGHHEVGVKFDFEIAHEHAVERAIEEFGDQLSEFAAFLEEYPMLGAAHSVGHLILDGIGSFPRTRLDKSTWYRARRIEHGRKLGVDDMRLPDPRFVRLPGRFNHLGQAHWYLADSEFTAAAEVVEEDESLVWMQKWIVEHLEPILDLVVFGPDDPNPVRDSRVEELPLLATAMIFGDHLRQDADRAATWKPEYFIPIYVADAAKRAGFKAIRFTSTRAYSDPNLVVFDSDAPVEHDGEPYTFKLERPADFGLKLPGEHFDF